MCSARSVEDPFVPTSDAPEADILCLVCRHGGGGQILDRVRQRLSEFAPGMSDIKVAKLAGSDVVLLSNKPGNLEHPGGLFSGVCVQALPASPRLLEGVHPLTPAECRALREPATLVHGMYFCIEQTSQEIRFYTDDFGLCQLYYLEFDGGAVISNRYHLLFDLVRHCWPSRAVLNVDAALALLWTDNVLTTTTLGESLWRDIRLLGHRQELYFGASGLRASQTPRWRWAEQPVSSDEAIKQYAEDLRRIMAAVAGLESEADFTIALTGGRDSRLLFAAAVAAGALSSVWCETFDLGDALDVSIGRGLAQLYGSRRSPKPSPNVESVWSADDYWAYLSSQLSGFSFTMNAKFRAPRTHRDGRLAITLSGGGGELLRAWYSHEQFKLKAGHSTLERVLQTGTFSQGGTAELYRGDVMGRVEAHICKAAAGAPFPDPLDKIDYLYESYRARGHCGLENRARWEKSMVSLQPLLTISAGRLAHSVPREERTDRGLNLRLLEELCPSLAGFRYRDGWWSRQLLSRSRCLSGCSTEAGISLGAHMFPGLPPVVPQFRGGLEQTRKQAQLGFDAIVADRARTAMQRVSREPWFTEYFHVQHYTKRLDWLLEKRNPRATCLALRLMQIDAHA